MMNSRVLLPHLVRASTARFAAPLVQLQQAVVVQHQHQQQQLRWHGRWTKARKKRFERHDRREDLVRQGKPIPKPVNFFPPDTLVVNALTEVERLADIKKNDEVVAAELSKKLKVAEPLLRFHMTGLKMSDRVRKLFDLHNGSQSEVIKAQKQRGMELFQMRQGDTGSSAVQVIALTTRIQQLQTHLGKHKKDRHSKRGMDALYVRRRKLLDYMERKDFDSFRKVVKTLGLKR
jgi:small subunit ribosomal protein S15